MTDDDASSWPVNNHQRIEEAKVAAAAGGAGEPKITHFVESNIA